MATEAYRKCLEIITLMSKGIENVIPLLVDDENKRTELIEIVKGNGINKDVISELTPRLQEALSELDSEDVQKLVDGGYTLAFSKIWPFLSEETQRKLFDDVCVFFEDYGDLNEKDYLDATLSFWKGTHPNIQIDKLNFFEYIIPEFELKGPDQNGKRPLEYLWDGTDKRAKELFLPLILEHLYSEVSFLTRHESGIRETIWGKSDPYLQEMILYKMLDIVSSSRTESSNEYDNPQNRIYKFLLATREEVVIKKLPELLEHLKNEPYFEAIARSFLGNVQIDSDGKITYPDSRIMEAILRTKERDASRVLPIIGTINNNINEVRYLLMVQRAISTIDQGLEFRLNAERLIAAASLLSSKQIDSAGLMELLLLKNAEYTLLTDTKYSEGGCPIDRAAEIADKKNRSGRTRKYPDFSFSKGDLTLHVYGPQEKAAMMLGYETNCCYRPSGHADVNRRNYGCTLYDYCNTTPYGGAMAITREIAGSSVTVMGTPILVNGNMGMFHSYETKTPSLDREKINDMLVEGACEWIYKDAIDVVMITDLFGPSRVDLSDKIVLPPGTFSPFLEGEYSQYEDMYTNITGKNHVVLAARVNGKVLRGKELLEWYERECGSDPRVFIEKLDLHTGRVSQDYVFDEAPFKSSIIIGESQNIDPELEQYVAARSQVKLGYRSIVEHYYEKYTEFYKQNKYKMELIRRLRELERQMQTQEAPGKQFIERGLPGEIYAARMEIARIIEQEQGLTIERDQLEKKIEQEERRIYTGLSEIVSLDNPMEFAGLLGIDKEVIARIEQRVDSELNGEPKKKTELTRAQKKIQSALVGMIRKEMRLNPENKTLERLYNQVIAGDLSSIDEDLDNLPQAIKDATKKFAGKFTLTQDDKDNISRAREESRVSERDRRIRAYIRDKDIVESIMADVMYGDDPSEERQLHGRTLTTKDKFRLFKYCITKGVKEREQIDSIMHTMLRTSDGIPHVDELHFGRNWFVAMSRMTHNVSITIDERSSEQERLQAMEQIRGLLIEKQRRFKKSHKSKTYRRVDKKDDDNDGEFD